MREPDRFVRGLVSWVGFRQTGSRTSGTPLRGGDEVSVREDDQVRTGRDHFLLHGSPPPGDVARLRGLRDRLRLSGHGLHPEVDGVHRPGLGDDHGGHPVPGRGAADLHRDHRGVHRPDLHRGEGPAHVHRRVATRAAGPSRGGRDLALSGRINRADGPGSGSAILRADVALSLPTAAARSDRSPVRGGPACLSGA